MTTRSGVGRIRLATVLWLAGCTAARPLPTATPPATAGAGAVRRLEPPRGASAFGLEFGATRSEVEGRLSRAGTPTRPDPADDDALLVERCTGAPAEAPCRLLFGPAGLYGWLQELPAAQGPELVAAVALGLGPARRPPGAAASLLAAWQPPGWTIGVDRSEPAAAQVTLRAEWDAAAPPSVSGVALGRRRAAVERALATQGATAIQRDEDATSYLGCPQGDGDAISCTVTFREGRAAAVTEVLPSIADDTPAMEAWRARLAAMEREIGRPPALRCPPEGPERIAGDCTATWSTARLVVVVGAHRSAGGQHRGAISVYLGYAYPPLGASEED